MQRLAILAFVTALSMPWLEAQRAGRKVDLDKQTAAVENSGRLRGSLANLARAPRASGPAQAASDQLQATLPQGPGVIQVRYTEAGVEPFFVITEGMPSGSTLKFTITFPDETGVELGTRRLIGDFYQGDWFALPKMETGNRFWKSGLTQFNIVMTAPDGSQTGASFDFVGAGSLRNASGTADLVPGINSWREYTAQDGSIMVEIKGRFLTGAKTYVAFDSYVVPQDALQVVDSSTLVVNLSNAFGYVYDDASGSFVPSFIDTTLMHDYLVTVGQARWSDSMPFRHTPAL